MNSPAEALAELLDVLVLGKAEDIHVGAVSIEGMSSRAERQILAKQTNGHIVAAGAAIGGERDLMQPVAVDRRLAEFEWVFLYRGLLVWLGVPPPAEHATQRSERRTADQPWR